MIKTPEEAGHVFATPLEYVHILLYFENIFLFFFLFIFLANIRRVSERENRVCFPDNFLPIDVRRDEFAITFHAITNSIYPVKMSGLS